MRLVTSLLTVGTSVAIGVKSGIRRSPSPVSPSSPIPAHARKVGGKCLLDLDDLEVEISVNKLNRIATKCTRKGTGKLEANIDTPCYGDNSYTCQELAQSVHDEGILPVIVRIPLFLRIPLLSRYYEPVMLHVYKGVWTSKAYLSVDFLPGNYTSLPTRLLPFTRRVFPTMLASPALALLALLESAHAAAGSIRSLHGGNGIIAPPLEANRIERSFAVPPDGNGFNGSWCFVNGAPNGEVTQLRIQQHGTAMVINSYLGDPPSYSW
ncbi:hypothetical protein FOZ62_027430 [Perkinsus olseni]|uniref:Uncharacterized protein n=1 Tax=Perkinsus olseni TaxID=32597 RepID=A0A7J6U5X3_PEROL|nr:hypothetical protein FOZ62_027430 [Perkinsus olseni]